jgi:hypothetical protein
MTVSRQSTRSSTNPIEGWSIVRELIEAAASEDELDYVAAGPLEDLLRLHGSVIASVIRRDAQQSQHVRDALSCVLLDPAPPPKWMPNSASGFLCSDDTLKHHWLEAPRERTRWKEIHTATHPSRILLSR